MDYDLDALEDISPELISLSLNSNSFINSTLSDGYLGGGELATAPLTNFQFVLYQIVVPLLFGLTSLFGVTGNTLVIYVIFSRKKMRTVTNILLLNLAFADLAFVLVIPNCTAYQFATSNWILGDAACKLMHYLVNITAYVTVYTLVLISVIRYLTIVHSVATVRFRTHKNIVLMIIGIWIVTMVLNIPVILSYGSKQLGIGLYDCEHLSDKHGQRIFATFFAFGYVLPLSIIAILSVCILMHLRKQKPAMLKGKKTKSQNKKKKAGRLIILVVVVFAILWLPVHIHLLVAFFGTLPTGEWYEALSVVFNVMAYFNACVNPIIYNQASKEFRDAFREVMFCVRYATRTNRSRETDGNHVTVTTRLMDMHETNGTQDKLLLSEVKGDHAQSDEV